MSTTLTTRLWRHRHFIDVSYSRGHGTLGPIVNAIEDAGATLERLSIDDEADQRRVSLTVGTRDPRSLRLHVDRLSDLPEVDAVAVSSRMPNGSAET
jgi:hypothetical protein